jgi:TrmH family RNA methyltransferase
MVVKSQIKFIKNLQQKKYRNLHSMFVVEGVKTVNELLVSDLEVQNVYTVDKDSIPFQSDYCQLVSASDLQKMSSLKAPNKVLGVFRMPAPQSLNFNDWILVLDSVKDPGNLGTIIRLCDWFGIEHLACSTDTVDCYNPKVLQATMGSITRVNVVYTDIKELILKCKVPVFGAFMEGSSIYSEHWPGSGVVVMGNEAHGISKPIEDLITKKIGIPQFGKSTAESLNVATATAIFLNEIRRS